MCKFCQLSEIGGEFHYCTVCPQNEFLQLRNTLRDRSEITRGEGTDICTLEKLKKIDPPQTLGKKIVSLPKTIQKKCDPPLEVQWPFLLKHKGTFRVVNPFNPKFRFG